MTAKLSPISWVQMEEPSQAAGRCCEQLTGARMALDHAATDPAVAVEMPQALRGEDLIDLLDRSVDDVVSGYSRHVARRYAWRLLIRRSEALADACATSFPLESIRLSTVSSTAITTGQGCCMP